MNIAYAQLNYHIGNFSANTTKIISAIEQAKHEQAELIVFSELCICGYPPLDLLEQKDFIENCLIHAEKIAEHCDSIAAIIGCPTINKNERGKQLFNSALFLSEKKITQVFHKTLLPTYDIFDEYRYFESNTDFSVLSFKGHTFAITICEDLWDNQLFEQSFAKNKLYKQSPLHKLSDHSPEMVINIAASPFSYNQEYTRTTVLQENAYNFSIPILYVNQVGANTEIIFDGRSKLINAEGEIVHELSEFEEDFSIINTETDCKQKGTDLPAFNKIEKIYKALILGITDFFAKNNFKTATLGLSGGIDSAVVLALVADAIGPENIRVLLMPSEFSSQHSVDDAVQLALNLNIHYDIIPIHKSYSSILSTLEPVFKDSPFSVAEENIQARLRGLLLMAISNKFGNILLNTSNKSEAAVGYSTMYGDMNGGLSILGDVYKKDVFALAHFINRNTEIIPFNSIAKPPSAELRPDQKDSDSLPNYETLDAILFEYIEKKLAPEDIIAQGYDKQIVYDTITKVNNNEYKRFQFPPILRISSKSFGFGRRIPLVAKHEWYIGAKKTDTF
ncbi:MAG: NAD+ synthase [Bacteroidales bacterium]